MANDQRKSNRPTAGRDPDLAGAEVALRRAAQKARERARRFGIGVAVWKAGRVVIEPADPRHR